MEVREKDNTPPVAKFLVEIDLNRYCQKIINFFSKIVVDEFSECVFSVN